MKTQPSPETTRPVLYSGPLSMFGAKCQIAALEKGLDVELVMVAYDSSRGYDPKHPDVLRINPKRQVPVLVHGSLEIFDSTQIFEYLEDLQPEPALWPREPQARARARLLEHRSDEVYFPHIIRLMGLQDALTGEPATTAIAAANRYYEAMDAQLAGRDWLAGDYGFADIAFYMAALFGERQGAPVTHATPRLLAWRERMGQRPPVRTVAGAMGRWLASVGRPVPAFMQALG
ncbi:MAG: glutathione S-transferase family protein [Ramlibacter sp.]|nr:glutathione S-transferase family protein [Ramlibacter sp.]MBX3659012.1 glutathione S-transferase family protein [Ramlibacter sp.]